MNEYFRAFIMNESWKEFMDKYNIDYLLLPPGRALAQIAPANGWNEVYRDEKAVIIVRN
jgi:hypothetical protein